jgi:hypothetical protein
VKKINKKSKKKKKKEIIIKLSRIKCLINTDAISGIPLLEKTAVSFLSKIMYNCFESQLVPIY